MASIYPEKCVFDGESHRTPEVNATALLIYYINRKLRHKKTGEKSLKDSYSGLVLDDIFRTNQFLEDLKVVAKMKAYILKMQNT